LAVVLDGHLLRQLLLRLLHVDVGVARVVEDAEVAVDTDVDARGLQQRGVVGVDPDASFAQQPLGRPVRENHGAILGRRAAGPRLFADGGLGRGVGYRATVAATRTTELRTGFPGP